MGATTWEVDAQGDRALRLQRHRRRRLPGPRPRDRRDDGRHLRHRQRATSSRSLFAPGNTIASTLANEFTEASDADLPERRSSSSASCCSSSRSLIQVVAQLWLSAWRPGRRPGVSSQAVSRSSADAGAALGRRNELRIVAVKIVARPLAACFGLGVLAWILFASSYAARRAQLGLLHLAPTPPRRLGRRARATRSSAPC